MFAFGLIIMLMVGGLTLGFSLLSDKPENKSSNELGTVLIVVSGLILLLFILMGVLFFFGDDPSGAVEFAYQHSQVKNITVESTQMGTWEGNHPYFYAFDKNGEGYILRNVWIYWQLKEGKTYQVRYVQGSVQIYSRIIEAKEI